VNSSLNTATSFLLRGQRTVTVRVHRAVRRARSRWNGRLAYFKYERTYSHPQLDVPPQVLADRVRSSLGPLERRLDLPHVHILVEGRTVLLHGDVASPADARAIEAHVAGVAGVRQVESHLHVGLLPSDARPSAGRAVHPLSPARRTLEKSAVAGGCDPGHTTDAVSAVLTVFLHRLPPVERHHVESHLPADVRRLVRPQPYVAGKPPRTAEDLTWRVVLQSDHIPPKAGGAIMRNVLRTLRRIVPEEVAGVADVLPDALREAWEDDKEGREHVDMHQ
jgi:uncharacterized protein (DUF2267 family)